MIPRDPSASAKPALSRTMSTREAAARLECSEQTIRRMAYRQVLDGTRRGRLLRVRRSSVEQYEQNRAVRPIPRLRPAREKPARLASDIDLARELVLEEMEGRR